MFPVTDKEYRMIPKIIHYCWFGGNAIPELNRKCIDSWRKHCPDFEIKQWDENNFDVNCCKYVKEAYDQKKWAFVTDYVRLFAMVTQGGIYMDTDVEVLKPLDPYLVNEAFSGFESETEIPTGIMGCEKGFPLFEELLNSYNDRSFINSDGSQNLTTNVIEITNYCKSKGFVGNNTLQTIEGFKIYPKEFFCPKDHKTGEINITDNTVTIHHFSGSWVNENYKIVNQIIRKYGKSGKITLTAAVRAFPYWLRGSIQVNGVKVTIKKMLMLKRNNVM